MNKNKIVKRAISKIKNQKIKKFLEQAVKDAPNKSPESFFKDLKTYSDDNLLSEGEYASMVEKLVRIYQLYSVSEDYKKELKKLVSNPPLKVYLPGLIF